MNKKLIGHLHSIFICKNPGDRMFAVPSAQIIQDKGIEGDRYSTQSGFWQKNGKRIDVVRHISIQSLQAIQQTDFLPQETRRNLIIDLADHNFALLDCLDKKIQIADVLFLVTEDCTPCLRPSQLTGKPDFQKVFKNTGGIRCQVLVGGEIQQGMPIFLLNS